ncbi:MAG: hypothetical protein KAU50_08255, partial [Candidatus Marinimicrobia bacterium]|nr:hypothetical protein [Candidatus Neomarinimicrobiota bacterium]
MRQFTDICMGQDFLSHLSATRDTPIFTTYAAHMDRSEFIVDEGYRLIWYAPDRAIEYETDNAGILSLGFKVDGEFRYHLDQISSEPVITTSYSDLVKYTYYPFNDIRVKVFFLVYSSRIAIQDVTITNEGTSTTDVHVYPILYHNRQTLSDVNLTVEHDGWSFGHQEHPDGWTTAHSVPYQSALMNAFLIDTPANAWGAYTDLGTIPPLAPALMNNAQQDNSCVEWGLVRHADSSLCNHTPPHAQQIILLNNSATEILTEAAPKWGDISPNIPGDGYQGCELGHFDSPAIVQGDSFQVIFTCLATGQQGIGQGVVPELLAPADVPIADIQLDSASFVPVPQQVEVTFYDGNEAEIRWEKEEGCTYSVYRRNALAETGEYDRVAQDISYSGWVDWDIAADEKYGYLVVAHDSLGRFSGHSGEVNNLGYDDFLTDVQNNTLSNMIPSDEIKVVAVQRNLSIPAGQSMTVRVIRGVTETDSSVSELLTDCRSLFSMDLEQFMSENEQLYSRIPRLNFSNPDYEMMYWSAFSMMRQVMLPPEGKCGYNYYVFSREPTWGWGHGGQVFHESLTMLAYAWMDPRGAMDSQRIYMERQHDDGYINYRTGPYLDETIPVDGQLTTSAPWYAWQNWEIYRITGDREFLQDAYESSVQFYTYYEVRRDADGDSLCEWGAHAVLESVRDGLVAVWDEVAWPTNFEAVDLNTMLVQEAKSLADMAAELGYADEAQDWRQNADDRARLINQTMWDEKTGFYYHVDKKDHDFTYEAADDLKREEIIGFLPLWAGIASREQAEQLVAKLTDPSKFWRPYGVPSLAADDSYYNPKGYWNGPVWVEWNFLIVDGLLQYGYEAEARELVRRVAAGMIAQLKKDHNLWEFY